MSQLATHTSFLVPHRRADIVSRPRLSQLLTKLARKKLVLIIAPAGYGKTTLLIDFAHTSVLPCCWYSIDQSDADIIHFLENFVAAIERLYPGFGKISIVFFQNLYSPDVNLDRVVTILVNEIYERIKEEFLIILDNFQPVDENPDIQTFIQRFVQKVGENCHLILSARRDPFSNDFDLQVTHTQIGYLMLDNLAFTTEEIQLLVRQNDDYLLSLDEAKQLERDTEGWVTGILLQPKLDRKSGWRAGSVTRLPGPRLYQYLEYQILNPLSADIRKFLLRTSLFYEFNSRLCEDVFGKTVYSKDINLNKLLEEILRNNLFLLTFGEQEPCFRYTQFFREFLRYSFEKELPGEKQPILVRLAEVYIERGMHEEAFKYLSELRDTQATVNLVLQFGQQMIREGRNMTLLHWLEQIPASILDANPDLLSLKGNAILTGREGEQAIPLLDRAIKAFRNTKDQPGLAIALVRRSTAHQYMGNLRSAIQDVDEALPMLDGSPENLSRRARALRTKGICFHDLGKPDEALALLSESLELCRLLKDEGRLASTLLDLGMVYRGRGELKTAGEIYRQSMDFLRKSRDMTRQANVLNNLGRFHLLEGDYAKASLLFNQAMECAKKINYSRMEAFTLSSFGDICVDLNAYEAASRAYFLSREIAERLKHQSLLFRLDLAGAALARKQGKIIQAHKYLFQAEKYIQSSSSVYESGCFHLELGLAELFENRYDIALESFSNAMRKFTESHRKPDLARANFLIAYTHFVMKQSDRSLLLLDQVLKQAEELEEHHGLVLMSREALDFLEFAHEQRPTALNISAFVERIQEFGKCQSSLLRDVRENAKALPELPSSIEIRVFGDPEVRIHTVELKTTDWQSLQQLELFLFIVMHPEGVTRKELEETFSFSTDKQFTNVIYRLRNVVGNEMVLWGQNRYIFDRSLDYVCDYERFQRWAEHAEATSSAEVKQEKYRQMVALYRGPLFRGAERIWIHNERESFARAYLKAALYIAQFHFDREEYPLVVDYCRRILDKDECQEDAHRLSIQAYSRLGNRSEVEKQYRWCVQALQDRYQAEPTEITKQIYKGAILGES